MKCNLSYVSKFFVVAVLIFPFIFSQNHEQIFSDIYKYQLWGTNDAGEGSSGPGSTAKNTEIYRNFIQDFLKTFKINSVVDLGCGDWEFTKLINWDGIDYLGLDIVGLVIERNIKLYSSKSIQFRYGNALQEELPSADLLICKDVLQHLPNTDIMKIIKQLHKYKYCLLTNSINSSTLSSDNPDISIGDYRPLDLTKPPFNLDGFKILRYQAGYFLMQTVLVCN